MDGKTLVLDKETNDVRHLETQKGVFSIEIPESIKPYFNRATIEDSVIDNVIKVWNDTHNVMSVDKYLLDEGKCTQEEREVIVEAVYDLFALKL